MALLGAVQHAGMLPAVVLLFMCIWEVGGLHWWMDGWMDVHEWMDGDVNECNPLFERPCTAKRPF